MAAFHSKNSPLRNTYRHKLCNRNYATLSHKRAIWILNNDKVEKYYVLREWCETVSRSNEGKTETYERRCSRFQSQQWQISETVPMRDYNRPSLQVSAAVYLHRVPSTEVSCQYHSPVHCLHHTLSSHHSNTRPPQHHRNWADCANLEKCCSVNCLTGWIATLSTRFNSKSRLQTTRPTMSSSARCIYELSVHCRWRRFAHSTSVTVRY